MSNYLASFAHTDDGPVGHIRLNAASDAQAVEEVREFVRHGYRNGTWASVELSDGRIYGCRNEHGDALGGYA